MLATITIQRILRKKGHGFWAVSPDATVYEALELMAERDIGGLPVVAGGKLVGIFTERDYARKVILRGRSSRTTSVRELMSNAPVTAGPDLSLRGAMAVMKEHHIRHLPVLQEGTLMGLVTIRDIVDMIISMQEEEISELENYIAGADYPSQAA